jgi:hypothetical protein
MPQSMREQLAAAARGSGRSLNQEIVHRLERSLVDQAVGGAAEGGKDVRKSRVERPYVAAALVVIVAAIAVGAGLFVRARGEHDTFDTFKHNAERAGLKVYGKGDPDAGKSGGQDAGTAKERATKPGNDATDPNTYEEQQLADLAYPSHTLPFSLFQNARSFFTGSIRGRGRLFGQSWQLLGPTTATVPAVLNVYAGQESDLTVSGRETAMAIDPNCSPARCQLWVAAAGGGIWTTTNPFSGSPSWQFVSGDLPTNAIGTLTYDPRSRTLYAGTGEPNASGDSEAGLGIYASNDGGQRWRLLLGSLNATRARSISSIVVDPRHPGTLYVGTTRGVRGVSSVTGGAVSLAPDAPPWGLYKTTNGGLSFTEVWDGHGSARGVNHVEMDGHGVLYAAAFQQGIWRSADGGSTWEQVFATQDPTENTARTEFALATTPDHHTRIYVGDGGTETGASGGIPISNTGVYRADAIDTKPAATLTDGVTNPGYVSLTSPDPTDPGWATYDYCETQCWYDNFVVSPPGAPNDVYVGGSFDYTLEPYGIDNGKAVLFSSDAGAHFTDQTHDASSPVTGIHPDQHTLVTAPFNPRLFFEGSDGGIMRSSGSLTDASGNCPTGDGDYTIACQNVTKAIPTQLTSLNAGLSTLQYQSVSTNPLDPTNLMGGTQDNGTWNGTTTSQSWPQTIYGDGGQSGYDVSNGARFTNFYSPYSDENFENGDPTAWVIVSGSFFGADGNPKEASAFYLPEIADPVVSGTQFTGLQHVWRTLDNGGDKATLEANCPEFTTFGGQPGCGDFLPLGDPTGQGGPDTPGDLTSAQYGADGTGGYVVALTRAPSDQSTLWAATQTGRVFVSTNANAADAGAVAFTRIDTLSPNAPARFVSSIVVDPTNPDHAWISYSGYNANTPNTPGHVFEVTYDPTAGTATWSDLDNGTGPLGDLPVTGLARDPATGTLYASTDFTVLADDGQGHHHFGNWRPAANGMPFVEVAGLTLDPRSRTLYAATHGRGVWSLQLPQAHGGSH